MIYYTMKECIICNKEFEPRQSNYKCCSKECSRIGHNKISSKYHMDRYKKAKLRIRHCAICNKIFKTNIFLKKCCSKECSKINKERYEKSDKRKKAHRIWRLSKRGKEWRSKYRNSDHGKLWMYNWRRGEVAKAWRRKNDATPKRKLGRKLYRQTERGKEVFRMLWRRREARKNNCINKFTIEAWQEKVKATNGICPQCKINVGIDKLTMDHIYPISKANEDYLRTGIKRIYTIDDVQPLCRSCNSSKHNKIIPSLLVTTKEPQETNMIVNLIGNKL